MSLVAVFIFGLIYGSFLNVVIYRYDDWRSILRGRSQCRSCQKQLGWFDLIPLFSFLALKGKCRYCQQPVSWQYPVVEFASATLLTAFYYQIFFVGSLGIPFTSLSGILQLILAVIIIGAVIVIFFHDLYEQMVPDEMAWLLLLATILFSLLHHLSPVATLVGILIGVLPIMLLVYSSGGRWMGEGDIKIAAAFGALVAYPAVIVYLFGAFLLGGVYGVLAIIVGKAKAKSAVPFVPFLVLGTIIAFFWGQEIITWYLELIGYQG